MRATLTGLVALGFSLALTGAAASQKPGAVFRDCAACPDMIVVPAGTYIMGSPNTEPERDADESPQHRVTITQPFAVSRFEVTRGQYAAFSLATGRERTRRCRVWAGHEWQDRDGYDWSNPMYEQDGSHPVVCVTWADAKAYVRWLAATTGDPYRLLSEAEWEYVARGGTVTMYFSGNDPDALCAHDNGHDLTSMRVHADMPWVGVNCDDGYAKTAPVGSFPPNPFGLHDVHGNVWEWLEDCYVDSYTGAPLDGSAVTRDACKQRVYRSGGWSVQKRGRRAANRGRFNPDDAYAQLGIRVARDLP